MFSIRHSLRLRPAALSLLIAPAFLLQPVVVRSQTTLSHVVPSAVAPGTTTELILHGASLNGSLHVWTSFPARVEIKAGDPTTMDPKQAICKVTLPVGAAPGIGGIAVGTDAGMSDVVYVMIDDLPTVPDNGNNHAIASPQDITLPAGIDGMCDGTHFDHYRFPLAAGQRISGEVVGARLGNDIDSIVRILDAEGNEVLREDDDPSAGADTRFTFSAPAAGMYTLELGDNRYKPGGRYRLRLGSFPLVSTPLPPFAVSGILASFAFVGPSVDNVMPLPLMPLAAQETAVPLGVRATDSNATGWTALAMSELPVALDVSLANQPGQEAVLPISGVASGVLEADGDQDYFSFAAGAAVPIRFRSLTRSIGSGAILALKVSNASGEVIAESSVTESDEPVLDFTPPQEGTYKLTVSELAGRGGPSLSYAVEACAGPQFQLFLKGGAKLPKYDLQQGSGAFTLDVQCQRLAYDGPITLSVDSPLPGWQMFNNVIPAKASEVRMYVVAPSEFMPGEIASLVVRGRGDSDSVRGDSRMSTAAQLRAARPHTPYSPAWHDGLILVGAKTPKAAIYRVTADRQEINFPRLVGHTQLTLKFERLDPAFKDIPLTVLPLGMPAGISVEVKRNGNGPAETYDLTLKGATDLAEGQHTLRYLAYAEAAANAGAGSAVYSGDLRLNVITPLAVTVAPAGPLTIGQKQKIKLMLTRRGDDKQAADVTFKSLPLGVTGPEKTTLGADQSEVEIELTAATDAPVTKFEQLIAVVNSKYTGADIAIESPAATLEVKAP